VAADVKAALLYCEQNDEQAQSSKEQNEPRALSGNNLPCAGIITEGATQQISQLILHEQPQQLSHARGLDRCEQKRQQGQETALGWQQHSNDASPPRETGTNVRGADMQIAHACAMQAHQAYGHHHHTRHASQANEFSTAGHMEQRRESNDPRASHGRQHLSRLAAGRQQRARLPGMPRDRGMQSAQACNMQTTQACNQRQQLDQCAHGQGNNFSLAGQVIERSASDAAEHRQPSGLVYIASFFTLSLSHQIFGHMHRVLNVDKKITNYTV